MRFLPENTNKLLLVSVQAFRSDQSRAFVYATAFTNNLANIISNHGEFNTRSTYKLFDFHNYCFERNTFLLQQANTFVV